MWQHCYVCGYLYVNKHTGEQRFRMILWCVEEMMRGDPARTPAEVVSDSQAVLKTVAFPCIRSRLIAECCLESSTHMSYQLCTPDNRKAGNFTKRAANRILLGLEPSCGFPMETAKEG